ncbi:hypothetical protein [Halocalculus aciditolerans]|uniref:Uncharacterized protein n=1 Tax=Halocalculus aciditolerans TaxID=1383812 RepID=A0A830F065_9EURY|nr:hypothetical protein [Halocalculus aciditolerans]GGL49868.1 hypothetical protein GCM10009039_04990 [Halocalculus aciditolerans]
MNLNRSSKALFVLVVVAVAAVAPAVAAPTVTGDVPDSAKVGAQQDVTFTVPSDGLYSDYDQWTLGGQTELTNVSWTVTAYDNTDTKIDQQTYTGQSFEYQVRSDEGVSKLTVRLQGATPAVEQYQYEPAQSFTFATFTQSQQGGSSTVLKAWQDVRPYTEQSQEARNAIEAAEQSISDAQAAGADTGEAEQLVGNAVNAYNKGNFDNAIDLANQAEQNAESAQQSNQLLTYALIGVGVLVLLGVVVGGVWYYRQNQGPSQPF